MKFDLLILAAGFGSRLQSLTKNKPKALIEYKKKKLIQIQLDNIDTKLINKIIIVLGYKGNMIKNFVLRKYPKLKFIFIKNKNFTKNNSGQSFYYAYKKINSNFYIHLNCDCIFTKKHFLKLIKNKKKNLISARSDILLENKSENIEAKNNFIKKMVLEKDKKCFFRGYGVAKISKNEMKRNIELYNSLTNSQKLEINYYSLIRKNIKHNNYSIIVSDKKNLHEINSQRDLKNCKLVC